MPSISVILPTYNRASVLNRAIASVLAQTEADFELIVVDDGSTDETDRVLAKIHDSRIRLIRSEVNRGGNWARNRGVEASRAELVAFLDSDDSYLEHKLEVILSLFAEHPSIDVWVDSFVCRDERDRGKPDKKKINPDGCEGEAFRAAVFERRIAKATTALSMRKKALVEVGLFDETLRRRQDLDVILRLSRRYPCRTTDRVLWVKYERADAISRDARTYLGAAIDICDRHPEYLEDHPDALYKDLRSHFSKLLKRREWKTFAIDARRYRAYRPFERSLLKLLLDTRAPRSAQADSTQRTRKDSGTPSRIAEIACAEASERE